jgi:tetratricopeptide (TPR) repeat protein
MVRILEGNMKRRDEAAGSRGFPVCRGFEGFPAVFSRFLVAGAVLVLAWGCSAKAVRPAGDAPAARAFLEEAERAVDAYEALESSGEAFFAAPPEMRSEKADRAVARLAQAAGDVEAWLEENPADPGALLLKARILRAQDAASPMRISFGPDGELVVSGESRLPEIQGLVDEVIARDPGNAAAHYWKARVSALQEPAVKDGTFAFEGGDAEKVLRHARRAVELAPEALAYREYYALTLLAAGFREGAMAVMRDAAGGNHPIHRLLADWELIPLPEDAVFDPMMTASMVQMYRASRDWGSYPGLRVAAFVVPWPADEVMAFYLARLGYPGRDGEAFGFPLVLAWEGERLVPVAVPPADEENFSGVLIVAGETEHLKPEEREALRLPAGGKACRMIIHNVRKFGAP